ARQPVELGAVAGHAVAIDALVLEREGAAAGRRSVELGKARRFIERHGDGAEQRLIRVAVALVDLLGRIQARAVHGARVLDGLERLVEERVMPPVPHQELRLADVEERSRLAAAPARPERHLLARAPVVEEARAWHVTARTRDFPALAHDAERTVISDVVRVE